MKKVNIEVTEDQAHLIQRALDFYSRIGIGQMKEILDHPTFERKLYKDCIPKKKPEVGDRTSQGKILEIKGDKALIAGSINNKGHWCEKHEWKLLDEIILNTDYNKYHATRDKAEELFTKGRNLLLNIDLTKNGSYGIFNEDVDDSCRVAYDILQVIRHKFWKENPNRSTITVDSSVLLRTKDSDKIKVKME